MLMKCCFCSTRAKKYFLCLVCGPASINTSVPKAKGEMEGDSGSDIDSEDEEETVSPCLCASTPQLCNCMLFPRVGDRKAKLIYYLLASFFFMK